MSHLINTEVTYQEIFRLMIPEMITGIRLLPTLYKKKSYMAPAWNRCDVKSFALFELGL
jgi:hypothetical protein